MNIADFFNKSLGIKESYQLPDALMRTLLNEEDKNKLMNDYLDAGFEVGVDVFNDYFEQGHGDRKNLMQDFTPSSITKLVEGLSGNNDKVLDICAGVGALSQNIKAETLHLEELSTRALPVLLFTLAITNKEGVVRNGDVLTREYKTIYKLEKGDRFSKITVTEEDDSYMYDLIVANPPYSLKWSHDKAKGMEEYEGYPLAPKSKADWAFVVGQLNRLKNNGRMMYVLPHGVLFRGGAEGRIRKQLLEENLISKVIGLPTKMFSNTDIPTVLLVLDKNKESEDVLFIDASEECIEENKRNVFSEDNLNKILATAKNNMEVKRFSHLASYEEIKDNDYNLNIPRYVETFIPEELPDLLEVLRDMIAIKEEAAEVERQFFNAFMDLVGTDEESEKLIEEAQRLINETN